MTGDNSERVPTNMQIDITGSIAVVTGASRGIGRQIACTLASAGADVAAVARTEDALMDLGDEVTNHGQRFLAIPIDLEPTRAAEEVAEKVTDVWGTPDVLVNAVGTMIRVEPPDIEQHHFDRIFSINVRVPFFVSQAIGRRMLDQGQGSIVNVASVAAEVVTRASVIYQASKAAVVQMTRAMAMRWGPHVRVNAVGPGYVETELSREWLASPDNRSWVIDHTALGRLGDTDDVANMVAFLASPLAGYVTGQHVLVDGGWGNP